MPIPLPHFVGLMAHELVDFVLVHAMSGQITRERMPQHMVATKHTPAAFLCDRSKSLTGCFVVEWLAHVFAKQVLSAGMNPEPIVDDTFQTRVHGYVTKRDAPVAASLLFANEDFAVEIVNLTAEHFRTTGARVGTKG